MKLLLDTHFWLWSHLAPDRLKRRVVQTLEDKANELWLSPISVWELVILVQKGRVHLEMDTETWVAESMARSRLRDAPLTTEVALETNSFQFAHRDPADRFLVAISETAMPCQALFYNTNSRASTG